MATKQAGSWANEIERLLRSRWAPGDRFTLAEVYEFIPELRKRRPDSANVEARVRDALQQLRQQRRLEFVAKGSYRLLSGEVSGAGPTADE